MDLCKYGMIRVMKKRNKFIRRQLASWECALVSPLSPRLISAADRVQNKHW